MKIVKIHFQDMAKPKKNLVTWRKKAEHLIQWRTKQKRTRIMEISENSTLSLLQPTIPPSSSNSVSSKLYIINL